MAIPGIVLAAGASHRFGQNKLLIPLGGHAVLYHALQAALTAPLDPVILVLGYESDKALQALEELRDSPKLRVLKNSHWAQWSGGIAQAGVSCRARARPRRSSAPGRYAARDPSADRTGRPSFSTRRTHCAFPSIEGFQGARWRSPESSLGNLRSSPAMPADCPSYKNIGRELSSSSSLPTKSRPNGI
jgi:hypothetical protein